MTITLSVPDLADAGGIGSSTVQYNRNRRRRAYETSVGDRRLAPDVTPLENIDFPLPLQRDVVCGRGGASSNHSGNIR